MKTKNCECPDCLANLDGVSCVTGQASPSPGDFTVCSKCGCTLIFDKDLNLERADPDVLADYAAKYPKEAAVIQSMSTFFKNAAKAGVGIVVLEDGQLARMVLDIMTNPPTGKDKPKRRFKP